MRPYTPILATLGYILSPSGKEVLLVHRNKRPNDAHLGKYNGLGGKVEVFNLFEKELAIPRCTVTMRMQLNVDAAGGQLHDLVRR